MAAHGTPPSTCSLARILLSCVLALLASSFGFAGVFAFIIGATLALSSTAVAVQTLAEQWLDWNKIGPLAAQWQALIADDLEKDTRKLDTYLAFRSGVTDDAQDQGGRGPGRAVSLKTFVEKRRAYLLSHLEVKRAGAARVARAAGPARPQAP